MVGLISDTHGLLRVEALRALDGTRLIIHAGDVGQGSIVEQLRVLAPVIVVRGNIDREPWPETASVEQDSRRIYVLHSLSDLALDAETAGYSFVISGHSHKAAVERRGSVVYVNPGSAGPRRFRLPVTVALLDCETAEVRIIDLLSP